MTMRSLSLKVIAVPVIIVAVAAVYFFVDPYAPRVAPWRLRRRMACQRIHNLCGTPPRPHALLGSPARQIPTSLRMAELPAHDCGHNPLPPPLDSPPQPPLTHPTTQNLNPKP